MEQLLLTIRYNDGKFPRHELEQIIERKEEAIPFLLQILNNLKEDYQKVLDRPTRIDFIYAYYLLAQFRVKELFPIMIDLLSMPSDVCDEIFSDSITEGIGSILATVYNGDLHLLQRLIENKEANEYARGQGLIALVALVFDGQLSREFVLEYFKRLMNERHPDASYYLNAEIVCCCDDLFPEEVYTDIRRMYEDRVVERLIGLNSIDQTLTRSKEAVLQSSKEEIRYQMITDAIMELQGWACFNQHQWVQSIVAQNGYPLQSKTVVVAEKIGRNEPCTCGSGKKYKKCCGA